MSKSKKLNWYVYQDKTDDQLFVDQKIDDKHEAAEERIAKVYGSLAHAQLIAAAPEMLEALEKLLDPKFRNDTGWTAVARLVKKARGEK